MKEEEFRCGGRGGHLAGDTLCVSGLLDECRNRQFPPLVVQAVSACDKTGAQAVDAVDQDRGGPEACAELTITSSGAVDGTMSRASNRSPPARSARSVRQSRLRAHTDPSRCRAALFRPRDGGAHVTSGLRAASAWRCSSWTRARTLEFKSRPIRSIAQSIRPPDEPGENGLRANCHAQHSAAGFPFAWRAQARVRHDTLPLGAQSYSQPSRVRRCGGRR